MSDPDCGATTTDLSWPGEDRVRRCWRQPHPPDEPHHSSRPDGDMYVWTVVDTLKSNYPAAEELASSVNAVCNLAEKVGGGRCSFDEALEYFESEITKLRSMVPLPAQMDAVHAKVLALRAWAIERSSWLASHGAKDGVVDQLDEILRVLPVQHDDQQGGVRGGAAGGPMGDPWFGALLTVIDPMLGRSFDDGTICTAAELCAAAKTIVLGLRTAAQRKRELPEASAIAYRELGEEIINLKRERAAARRPVVFTADQTADMAKRLQAVRRQVREVLARIGTDHPAFESVVGAANDITAIFASMPAKE